MHYAKNYSSIITLPLLDSAQEHKSFVKVLRLEVYWAISSSTSSFMFWLITPTQKRDIVTSTIIMIIMIIAYRDCRLPEV